MSEPTSSPAGETQTPGPSGRKRRFVWRWTRRSVALVLALLAAVFVSTLSINLGRFPELKQLADRQASKFLNRPAHIGGISAYVWPGEFGLDDVVIEGLTPTDRPFLSAQHVRVSIPWWRMLTDRQLVVEVRMTGWKMVVESWANGRHNVPTLLPKRRTTGPSWFSRWVGTTTVNFVYATHGEFVYDDHATPWSVNAPNLDFELVRAPNLNAYVGNARFTGGSVRIMDFLPMRTDLRARFVLDGPRVQLQHIDLVSDGSRTHASGTVDFANWPEQVYNVNSTVDFARMRELFFASETWRATGTGQFAGVFHLPKAGGRELEGQFTSDDAVVEGVAFPELHGSLLWTRDRFAVTHADAGVLGGAGRLSYELAPLGAPTGSMATFAAEYNDVDLARLHGLIDLKGIQLVGRATGTLSMAWPNGKFAKGRQGSGHTLVSAPAGVVPARVDLPAMVAPPFPEPKPFEPHRAIGPLALSADLHYHLDPDGMTFDDSVAATAGTYMRFQGRLASTGPSSFPFHVTSHDWQESDRLLVTIMTALSGPTGAIAIGGQGTFDGRMTGQFSSPRIEGRFVSDGTRVWDVTWGHMAANAVIQGGYVDITNSHVGDTANRSIVADGRFALGYRARAEEEINAHVTLTNWPMSDLRHAFSLDDWPMDGTIASADLKLTGQYRNMFGSGPLTIAQGAAWGEHFDTADGHIDLEGTGLVINDIELHKGPGVVTGAARIGWDGTYEFNAKGTGILVGSLDNFKLPQATLTGVLGFTAIGNGAFASPSYQFQGEIPDLFVGDEGVGDVTGELRVDNQALLIERVAARSGLLDLDGKGTIALNPRHDAELHLTFTESSLDPYFKFLGPSWAPNTDHPNADGTPRFSPYTRAIVSGGVDIAGPLSSPHELSVDTTIHDATLTLYDYDLTNDGPIAFTYKGDQFHVGQFKLKGADTSLSVTGGADVGHRTWNLMADGSASLSILQLFFRSLSASGAASLNASLTGSFDAPVLGGGATVSNGRLRPLASPHSLEALNGRIRFESGQIALDGMTGRIGNGAVTFGGDIALSGYTLSSFNLTATGRTMRLRYPTGFQSIANMDLQLIGPASAPRLVGDVDVVKTGLTGVPESVLLGLMASTPDNTPAAPASVTSEGTPLALDIHVTAPRMPFIADKSTLVEGTADLHVGGTFDRPVILGAVDITGGYLLEFGNRYTVLEGSIEFNNPDALDPVFDLALETRPRILGDTYYISVHFSGTSHKLGLTLQSDPPLPDSEIVTLLMGGTPNVGEAEEQAVSSPQELQQQMLQTVGAVLLTAPISSRVGDVVAKALPVDAVQVMPVLQSDTTLTTLSTVNPSARVTFAKRISNHVTLTYSRTVSGLEEDLIVLEYDESDRVSWVLSRNEDKSLSLDYRIRHVF